MTQSRYLWRRLQRAIQQHHDPSWQVNIARFALAEHVDAKVRPSMTDTVWRSKRQGGPLQLDFGQAVQEAD